MEATQIWEKYQKSLDYLRLKAVKTRTEKNYNFYIGKQWEGIQLGGETNKDELPIMNIIKPIIKYKVSTIGQRRVVARYQDMGESRESEMSTEICKALNDYFSKAWERSKMDTYSWKMIKACAIQGDSYLYFGSQSPCDEPIIIPNTSMLLGDENTTNIQNQPYIIIRERLSLEEVKKRAKKNGIKKDVYNSISSDSDTTEQIVNDNEVDNKVTSLVYMQKINGIVNVARSTQTVLYEKFHPLEQELDGKGNGIGAKFYPIVPMVWEELPNTARGASEVEQEIPNQLALNKTLARRSVAIKMSAFPRLAYDTTAIDNPDDLDRVGAKLGINGLDSRSVNQMISYLQPAPMTSDPKIFSDELLNNTKDLAGAGDFATGNINPERTSGAAITALREQAQQPLNEQVKMYEQFVENVAHLWFDMLRTYNSEEVKLDVVIPSKDLQKIEPDIRIDVSDESAWSKYVEQQKLDNLLEGQYITFDEYIEVMPEDASFPKSKILAILERRGEQLGNQEIGAEQGQYSEEEIAQLQAQINQNQGGITNTAGAQEGYIPDGGYMA